MDCKIFARPWRKRQMLGSVIKISKLIFATLALRICATFLKLRYINARTHLAVLRRDAFFFPEIWIEGNASNNKPAANTTTKRRQYEI